MTMRDEELDSDQGACGDSGRGGGSFLVSGAGQGRPVECPDCHRRRGQASSENTRTSDQKQSFQYPDIFIDVTYINLVTILAACDREKCVSVGGTGAG